MGLVRPSATNLPATPSVADRPRSDRWPVSALRLPKTGRRDRSNRLLGGSPRQHIKKRINDFTKCSVLATFPERVWYTNAVVFFKLLAFHRRKTAIGLTRAQCANRHDPHLHEDQSCRDFHHLACAGSARLRGGEAGLRESGVQSFSRTKPVNRRQHSTRGRNPYVLSPLPKLVRANNTPRTSHSADRRALAAALELGIAQHRGSHISGGLVTSGCIHHCNGNIRTERVIHRGEPVCILLTTLYFPRTKTR